MSQLCYKLQNTKGLNERGYLLFTNGGNSRPGVKTATTPTHVFFHPDSRFHFSFHYMYNCVIGGRTSLVIIRALNLALWNSPRAHSFGQLKKHTLWKDALRARAFPTLG